MAPMNVFRIFADLAHTASKCILIWAIHSNKSAEGVSLLTQLLYLLVFCSRYLDLFFAWVNWWNFVLKILYIASSAYIVFAMMRMFARTREKEYAWKLAIWSLAGSAVSAPLVCLLFEGWAACTWFEVVWTFSIILESVAVLPQLLLLRQTSVPTVLDSFYLVALGSYRFFYILNWIMRGATHQLVDATSVVFGIIQTALYVDFAWVYYTRQRVKLRGGGVVDGEDLNKGFLVKRLIGRRSNNHNQENDDNDETADDDAALAAQENGTVRITAGRRWGARGVSVSADDTLQEHFDGHARDAQMVDPFHFEDDEMDADAPVPLNEDSLAKQTAPSGRAENSVDSSAGEWQQNTSDRQ